MFRRLTVPSVDPCPSNDTHCGKTEFSGPVTPLESPPFPHCLPFEQDGTVVYYEDKDCDQLRCSSRMGFRRDEEGISFLGYAKMIRYAVRT